jgi:outer membrane protein TolC
MENRNSKLESRNSEFGIRNLKWEDVVWAFQFQISNFKFYGGSLRAGLSAATPPIAPSHFTQGTFGGLARRSVSRRRGFRCYPCRATVPLNIVPFQFDIRRFSPMRFKFQISNFKLCSILLLIIATLGQLNAQVVSLDSVLSTIDRQNPMLQEYESKVKALNEYAGGAKSWMAPMVGAGTFMTPYKQVESIHGEREKGSWMFSFEQQIPNPAKLTANKKYLESRAGVVEQGRAIQFNTLRAEAKTYYYQWLVAEKRMTVLKENKTFMELLLKLARLRYPYNQGNLGNIYKAEGRLSESENMLLMTRSDIEDKSYRLKALMNLPASDSIMVDTATTVTFTNDRIAGDTTSLSRQRSDIRQIDENIEAMRLNQQLQKFSSRPDFRIRFDHMQAIGDMPNQFTAMAMVSIPIAPWSSRMYRSEIKGMQFDIDAMKKSREAILLEARGMLAGMARQLTRMKQQLENYDLKIIPALQKNSQALMLAYEENREQLPMVIDGWEALNMAQAEYLEKMEAYYKMIVAYEKELEK